MTTLAHVLDARRCGVYRLVGNLPVVPPAIRQLEIPAVRGKVELMQAFAQAADLPAWFGHNWDALEESLLDLATTGRDGGVLVHLRDVGILARRDADTWHTLLVMLGDVAEEWERRGGLFVVLVTDDAPGVESIPRIGGV